MLRSVFSLAIAATLLLATGCASFDANVETSADLSSYRYYFVQSNTNDDHALASSIAAALRSHGLDADHGPLTMMQDTAELIVSYDDRWTWDFKNHMLALRIVIRKAADDKPIASASFYSAASMNTDPQEVVARLVNKILTTRPNPAS
jgi:hypothetical protein